MTDNDKHIVQTLKYHIEAEDCVSCEAFGKCDEFILTEKVLDLINRQKAEIERLREETAELIDDRYATQLLCHLIKKEDDTRNVRSDAIKEFADRLISVSHPYADTQMVFEIQIKNLVKEMVGDNNAE